MQAHVTSAIRDAKRAVMENRTSVQNGTTKMNFTTLFIDRGSLCNLGRNQKPLGSAATVLEAMAGGKVWNPIFFSKQAVAQWDRTGDL